jgi:hypothetical protein
MGKDVLELPDIPLGLLLGVFAPLAGGDHDGNDAGGGDFEGDNRGSPTCEPGEETDGLWP